jgi:SNF2 family DNA or RNA helicase
MSLGAFVSLEDISEALPPYQEEVVGVQMDRQLKQAYEDLEEQIKKALKEHRGNPSVISTALNALLLFPDRPFGIGDLYGFEYNPETQQREKFLIAETKDLEESFVYAKERKLVEEVKTELKCGRRCQIYAVYTQKRDVLARLAGILVKEGIRVAVLRTEVPPEAREAWYERELRAGAQAFICHPKLVQTGLDLVFCETILFYETGYSIYVLRQASRRSWRIGQSRPVKVKFLHYDKTMQENCLRLMGKKLLVSLAMEGKFTGEGLQSIDDGDDILMSMARELVTERGIGESADAVWRQLQKQHREIFGIRSGEMAAPDAIAATVLDSVPEVIVPPAVQAPDVVTQLLMFGASLESVQRRKASRRPTVAVKGSNQLALF